jgi:hypothetical protein
VLLSIAEILLLATLRKIGLRRANRIMSSPERLINRIKKSFRFEFKTSIENILCKDTTIKKKPHSK